MSTEKDYVKFLQDQGKCIPFNAMLFKSTGTQFFPAHHNTLYVIRKFSPCEA